jgi:putative effector of murein hydrolase
MLLPVPSACSPAASDRSALGGCSSRGCFGASLATQLSLAPKSVTTPIAMGIAERIGGLPSLTAVLVITTGILGAVAGRYLFDALRIARPGDPRLRHGVTAHGIGTARAFQESEQAGAFAALAMGMNGLLTACCCRCC